MPNALQSLHEHRHNIIFINNGEIKDRSFGGICEYFTVDTKYTKQTENKAITNSGKKQKVMREKKHMVIHQFVQM